MSKPMSNFLCKTILFGSCNLRILSPISKNPNLFSLKWISTSSSQHSFAVSYLINSLGFSPESAFSSSKYVNFKSPEKPEKVINLFKKYGFTQIQISSLCRRKPTLLSLDAEDIILPKLEFFEAKGFSGPEIAKMVSVFPNILASSLTNQIMPAYDFIRNLFQSEEKVVVTVKRFPDILTHNIEKYVVPNVDILREHGVPEFRIARLMQNYAGCFITTPHYFRKAVEKAVEMGCNASNVNFVLAVNVLRWMSKSKWKSKVDAYKKWGVSEEEVLKAFKKSPWFMMVSEDKLMASMDFFINQMGWKPCLIAQCPVILTLSLKKRVVPRCSVFQVLLSKGLVKKEVGIAMLLLLSEEKFVQKFVTPYKEEFPELLKLYKEKLDLSKEISD